MRCTGRFSAHCLHRRGCHKVFMKDYEMVITYFFFLVSYALFPRTTRAAWVCLNDCIQTNTVLGRSPIPTLEERQPSRTRWCLCHPASGVTRCPERCPYPLRTWMRSVLYFRGVNSQRRTWRASRTLPSSRYSRYFCCSSKNFILWQDRKQRSGERSWRKVQKMFVPKQNSRNHSTMPFENHFLKRFKMIQTILV